MDLPPSQLTKSQIKAATLNMCSISNNHDNIVKTFHGLKLDFLCLTETWLSKNDIPIISSLNTSTTCFIHPHHNCSLNGGAIGILYRNNIKLKNNKDLSLEYSETSSCTFQITK